MRGTLPAKPVFIRPPRYPPVEHFAVLRTTPASSTLRTCALRKSKTRVLLNAQKVKHVFQKCANAVLLLMLFWVHFCALVRCFVAPLLRCSVVCSFGNCSEADPAIGAICNKAICIRSFAHSFIRSFGELPMQALRR